MIEANKTVLRGMPDGIGFVAPSEDQIITVFSWHGASGSVPGFVVSCFRRKKRKE